MREHSVDVVEQLVIFLWLKFAMSGHWSITNIQRNCRNGTENIEQKCWKWLKLDFWSINDIVVETHNMCISSTCCYGREGWYYCFQNWKNGPILYSSLTHKIQYYRTDVGDLALGGLLACLLLCCQITRFNELIIFWYVFFKNCPVENV